MTVADDVHARFRRAALRAVVAQRMLSFETPALTWDDVKRERMGGPERRRGMRMDGLSRASSSVADTARSPGALGPSMVSRGPSSDMVERTWTPAYRMHCGCAMPPGMAEACADAENPQPSEWYSVDGVVYDWSESKGCTVKVYYTYLKTGRQRVAECAAWRCTPTGCEPLRDDCGVLQSDCDMPCEGAVAPDEAGKDTSLSVPDIAFDASCNAGVFADEDLEPFARARAAAAWRTLEANADILRAALCAVGYRLTPREVAAAMARVTELRVEPLPATTERVTHGEWSDGVLTVACGDLRRAPATRPRSTSAYSSTSGSRMTDTLRQCGVLHLAGTMVHELLHGIDPGTDHKPATPTAEGTCNANSRAKALFIDRVSAGAALGCSG